MRRNPVILTVLLALLSPSVGRQVAAAERIDAGTIRAGLRTANPNDEDYITYVVALRDQGELSNKLVDSTFQWARRRIVLGTHRRFQYYKNALITQAAKVGITLPQGTPDITPAITGRVVLRVILIDIPCPNCTVTIQGTKRRTTTNAKGEFTLRNVPYGTPTLLAQGTVLLFPRSGSLQVVLPTPPPSDDVVPVEIRVK